MVVGILFLAGTALGVTYAKYDEATTEIILEDGITCTINGKEVSNGEKVTSEMKGGYLNVHAESETPIVFGYSGVWYSDDRADVQNGKSTDEVTSYDFKIPFNHGKYNGRMVIKNDASDSYGYVITMVLHFDESKMTLWFSFYDDFRHDGDTVHILGDDVFEVRHVDKQTHDFSWDGYYRDDWGNYKALQGAETTDDVLVRIASYDNYNAPASGEITFTVAN